MNKLTYSTFLTRCFLCFALAALLANCNSEKNKANYLADPPPEIQQLLSAADTLTADALAAEARKLPGTWADTFFHFRRLALALKQDGPGLKAAMSVYEKIRPGDEAAGAFINLSRGIAHQFATRYDSAEIHYKLAQDWYQQTGDKKSLEEALTCHASICRLQGRFDETIALQYQYLELASTEQARMNAKAQIAATFILKGDTSKPFELLEEPLRFYEQAADTFHLAFTLTILGNAFSGKKDYVRCLETHQKALLLRRQIGKHGFTLENLQAIANMHNRLGNWQAALDTVQVAEKLLVNVSNKHSQNFFQLIAGEVLFHLGRLPEADAVLLQCLEKFRARKQYKQVVMAADMLSKSKKKQGKLAEALDFREQCVAFNDSLFSKEKEKIIQETATKYETREKQAQIETLKREKQLADQRNAWIAAFLLSFAGAGAWFLRYRHRREKFLLEKNLENQRLENEVLLAGEKLNRQSLENAAREIEWHKTQLEEFTTLMMEKNTRIEALQSKIEQVELPGESSSARSFSADEADVDALFQTALLTESDWQRFQKHFEKVFPGVLGRLKIQYPELSTAELRLVLLTKMGLKTKEISSLLGISLDSVRKLQYRFKKKMGCSEQELLEQMGERGMGH